MYDDMKLTYLPTDFEAKSGGPLADLLVQKLRERARFFTPVARSRIPGLNFSPL